MKKFNVAPEFRKNALAGVQTNLKIEVHSTNQPVKVYDNIHFPESFARKVFKGNPTCTHVVIIEGEESRTINRP